MKQRTKSEITIKRDDGSEWVVPITEQSRRKFVLMSEDSITLSFSLTSAVAFYIGDYIEDELFGRFVITKEQMPKYNKSTGGYDYTLVFEAAYYEWRNFVFALTTTLSGTDNRRIRKEVNWVLTAPIQTHVEEIINNLNCLKFTEYSYEIHTQHITRHQEARCLSYSGIDIVSALTQIANAWECEWWVVDKVIHFGKCINEAQESLVFALNDNVETMDIQDNRSSYANYIWAFGGTKNVPSTYDKELIFTCDKAIEKNDMLLFADSTRKLTSAMMQGDMTRFERNGSGITIISDSKTTCSGISSLGYYNVGRYQLSGSVDFDIAVSLTDDEMNAGGISHRVEVFFQATLQILQNGNVVQTITLQNQSGTVIAQGEKEKYLSLSIPLDQTINLSNFVEIQLNAVATFDTAEVVHSSSLTLAYKMLGEESMTYKRFQIIVNEKTCNVRLNPFQEAAGDEHYYMFAFEDEVPADFMGKQFTLAKPTLKVPASYWTTSDYDDPSALAKIGERRIHQPKNAENPAPVFSHHGHVVEQVVLFENVFPKLTLAISSDVREVLKRDETELEDGSKNVWEWTQYSFKANFADGDINGKSFHFDTDYILEGNKLQALFITSNEELDSSTDKSHEAKGEYKLSGMTFEVGFNNSTQEFTLKRNEDYGTYLPNNYLRPNKGDAFVLIGWNPLALSEMGLIEQAENQVVKKLDEYCDALESAPFTFTCHMMSNWFFVSEQNIQLHTKSDEPIEDRLGAFIYLSSGNENFALPIEGTPVKVNHSALPNSSKESRVIGYEFKLDMPWDSPTYTVGETQAYSRLAKIEKEITKLK